MDVADFVEVGHAAVVAAVAVDDAAETLIQWLSMHHVGASSLKEGEGDSCSLLIHHSMPFVSRKVFRSVDNLSNIIFFLFIDFTIENHSNEDFNCMPYITSPI